MMCESGEEGPIGSPPWIAMGESGEEGPGGSPPWIGLTLASEC